MKYLILFALIICFNFSNSQTASSDDGLHFGVGALISSSTYALVYSKTKNKKKAFWYSMALSSLAGFGKELHDKNIARGRFDTSEFLATAAGGITASFTINLFTGKRKKEKQNKAIPIVTIL